MAVQQSTPTLSFRGTPILIEGLVPFEYRHILGGAAVRVSLAGRDKKGGHGTAERTNAAVGPGNSGAILGLGKYSSGLLHGRVTGR